MADDWKALAIDWFPTGSRYICNPPPMDTDEDYCAMIGEHHSLASLGFTQDGRPEFYTGNDNGGFRSWRRGEINVISTDDREFFELFRTATELAKRFNLTRKSDRIALFQAVLYGVRVENLALPPMASMEAAT